MFAIVSHGGRQYRVEPGTVVKLDRADDLSVGSDFAFGTVVFASLDEGSIIVGNKISIKAQVVKHGKDDKVIVFKKHRRKSGFTRTRGHVQRNTMVFVESISVID